MTYSRPGIRQVGVASGRQFSNEQSVQLSQLGRVSDNAPYRDERNPAQAARNVAVKYQGINALLEFANSPQTRQFVADEIDRQAKKDASAVVDSSVMHSIVILCITVFVCFCCT